MMKMKSYNIEISREVVYWESAIVSVEANSEEEAKEIALLDAKEGYIDPDHFNTDEHPRVNYEAFLVEDE